MAGGTLYMIPVELGEVEKERHTPPFNLSIIDRLDAFVVENARTTRQYLRKLFPEKELSALTILEADKHRGYSYPREELLDILRSGRDAGFMSEAGCPGVADPGAGVVEDCHKEGFRVVPLVGPSSILLGLMASGFSGQSFRFLGYLPFDKVQRQKSLREIALRVERFGETQIFIEAPYRNDRLLAEICNLLPPSLSLCLCAALTTPEESVSRHTVTEWQEILTTRKPSYHKVPAIFLIGK